MSRLFYNRRRMFPASKLSCLGGGSVQAYQGQNAINCISRIASCDILTVYMH